MCDGCSALAVGSWPHAVSQPGRSSCGSLDVGLTAAEEAVAYPALRIFTNFLEVIIVHLLLFDSID